MPLQCKKYFTPDRKITATPSDDEDMAMTIVMIMIAMGKVDNGVGEIKLPHAEIKIKSQWGESGAVLDKARERLCSDLTIIPHMHTHIA